MGSDKRKKSPKKAPGRTRLRSEFRMIGPREAAKILENVAPNRTFRQATSNLYARDMSNGRWKDTWEPIQIDTNGDLRNGQHRLHAIITSGKRLKFLVVEGVEADDSLPYDVGRRRTAVDIIETAKKQDTGLARILGPALRMHVQHSMGDTHFHSKWSQPELLDWLDGHLFLVHSSEFVRETAKGLTASLRPIPLSQAAFLHVGLSKVNKDAADGFIEQLFLGTDIPARSNVLTLRRLLENWKLKNRTRPSARILTAVCIKAFNYELAHYHPKTIRFSEDEAYPTPGRPSKDALRLARQKERRSKAG